MPIPIAAVRPKSIYTPRALSLARGLVSYWKGNEVAGATRVDSVSGYNLADVGSNVRTNTGLVYPLAAEFLAADNPLRYLKKASGISGSGLDSNSGAFTLAVFYMYYSENEGTPHYRTLFQTGNANTSGGIFAGLTQSQAFNYMYRLDNTSSITTHSAIGVPEFNAWKLGIKQYDLVNGRARSCESGNSFSWIDAISGVDGVTDPMGAMATTLDELFVGLDKSGTFPMDGRIFPILYWNRLITDTEITQLWNNGAGLTLEAILNGTTATAFTVNKGLLLSDAFTGTDNTSNDYRRATTCPSGATWLTDTVLGSFILSSNTLIPNTTNATRSHLIRAQNPNATVAGKVRYNANAASQTGFALRAYSGVNCIACVLENGSAYIYKIIDNVYTVLASTALTLVDGDWYNVSATANGTALSMTVGATTITATSNQFQTNITHGVFAKIANSVGNQAFDDVSVTGL